MEDHAIWGTWTAWSTSTGCPAECLRHSAATRSAVSAGLDMCTLEPCTWALQSHLATAQAETAHVWLLSTLGLKTAKQCGPWCVPLFVQTASQLSSLLPDKIVLRGGVMGCYGVLCFCLHLFVTYPMIVADRLRFDADGHGTVLLIYLPRAWIYRLNMAKLRRSALSIVEKRWIYIYIWISIRPSFCQYSIWCDSGRSAARFMSGLVTQLVLLAAQTVAAVFGRMTLATVMGSSWKLSLPLSLFLSPVFWHVVALNRQRNKVKGLTLNCSWRRIHGCWDATGGICLYCRYFSWTCSSDS